jgi:hypothetical protein
MFLRREYRNRAIGLLGAYAVLITGVVTSGAFELAPKKSAPMHATEAALDRSKTKRADDCSSALCVRSEIVC